jgi:hypothetical protein
VINIACLIGGRTSKQDFSRLILYSDDDCGLKTRFVSIQVIFIITSGIGERSHARHQIRQKLIGTIKCNETISAVELHKILMRRSYLFEILSSGPARRQAILLAPNEKSWVSKIRTLTKPGLAET